MSDSDKIEPEKLQDLETQAGKKRFIESDAGDGTKREEQYLHGAHLIGCFIAIFLCMFLTALDQTIVATILTTVGDKFHAFGQISWLISGFLLTMGAFIQMFGKLSIIFGRKYTMLVAIVIFELGSLICAVAPNMNVLIGGRVVAGMGASGIQGLSFVIVSEVVPIEKRPIGMAIMSCVFAFASVLGPLVGGAFTTHVSWRWCFYVNLPIGAVAFAFLSWAFNPPRPKINFIEELKKFDYFGAFLLVSGWILLLIALTFGANEYAWDSPAVIATFIIAGSIMIGFVVWNLFFSKNQLFATEIIVVPQIMASVLAITGIFAFSMTSLSYISIYFQVVLGYSALGCGIHLLPLTLSVVVSSLVAGFTIQKFRYIKPFCLASAILAPISGGLIMLFGLERDNGKQVGFLIIAGVSVGLLIQPSLISSQIKAPKTPGSTIMVTTFYSFSRAIGSALGTALGNVIYSVSLRNLFKSKLATETNPQILEALQGQNINQLVSDNTFIAELNPVAQIFVKTQILHAIRKVYWLALAFAFVGSISTLFITNKRLPQVSGRSDTEKEEKEEERTEEPENGPSGEEIEEKQQETKAQAVEMTESTSS
ncbi:multidrug-resistance transporte [Scheffersomyces coipomensis]|uniref:multidrug-resistance transporte n=1 Tax=Scheffersomyces coipomensis TaxID=1788519 RepID=UPI00315D7DE3